MVARNLLHKTKLEEFKLWLDSCDRQHRPGNGDYQVLQVKHGSGWMPIFSRNEMPEHLSVPDPLIGLVRLFLQDTRRVEVPPAPTTQDTPPWE